MIDAIRRMSGDLDTTAKESLDTAAVTVSNSLSSTVCDDPLRCPTLQPIEDVAENLVKTTAKKVVEAITNNITNNDPS